MFISRLPKALANAQGMLTTSAGFLACVLSSQAVAQTNTDSKNTSPEALETLVVTGTRTERNLSDAPVKVEVIKAETLRAQHAFSLEDGLKTLPGIQLKPIERKFGTEAWIQGISADRILVLIDGEPTSPTTGSSIDLSQISATNIQ
ncbi:MAG: TonB-dependent receptor plug domain-containing protein, partial [Pseudomonadales bacterium]|nr:TonB-dependent receptor plug domain-containing protein [Pseudomonadales bacterium]